MKTYSTPGLATHHSHISQRPQPQQISFRWRMRRRAWSERRHFIFHCAPRPVF